MASVNANSLDFLKGVRAQIDVAPWITATGGTAFKHVGWVEGLSFAPGRDVGKIEPGNNYWPVAPVPQGQSLIIKGNILQADLRLLSMMMGGVDADVLVVTGTATLPLKELAANPKTIRIEIADQSMTPGHTEIAAQTYIKRTLTVWNTIFKITGDIPLDKKEIYKIPFEAEAYFDTSQTVSTTNDGIGKIADTTTGSYTA